MAGQPPSASSHPANLQGQARSPNDFEIDSLLPVSSRVESNRKPFSHSTCGGWVAGRSALNAAIASSDNRARSHRLSVCRPRCHPCQASQLNPGSVSLILDPLCSPGSPAASDPTLRTTGLVTR